MQETSRSVFKFSCPNVVDRQCFWTKMDYELRTPSAMGLALTIPRIPMLTRGYSNARDCSEGNIHKLANICSS